MVLLFITQIIQQAKAKLTTNKPAKPITLYRTTDYFTAVGNFVGIYRTKKEALRNCTFKVPGPASEFYPQSEIATFTTFIKLDKHEQPRMEHWIKQREFIRCEIFYKY